MLENIEFIDIIKMLVVFFVVVVIAQYLFESSNDTNDFNDPYPQSDSAIAMREKMERKVNGIRNKWGDKMPKYDEHNDGLFYVYQYVLDGEVKYIGKGTIHVFLPYMRAFDVINHNKHCVENRKLINIEIVKHFDFEDDSFNYESKLIKEHGLNNLWNTNGGRKTKECKKCFETKSVLEFYKRKTSKDGLNTKCKTCISEQKKAYAEV